MVRLKRMWRNRVLYLMLLVPFAMLILFRYVPMYGVQIAFKNYLPSDTIQSAQWVGMKYVMNFITNFNFRSIVLNTLVIGVYSLGTFFCAPTLAVCINYLTNQKLKKTIQTVSYLPHFISTVVMCSIILQIFDARSGLFNAFMNLFGVQSKNYMGMPGAFAHVFIWTGIWQDVGYASIIYIASLASVSPEYHEAAMIDGATLLKRIWHVDIPCLLPTMCVLLIMRCGQVLNVGYEKVYLLQNSMNLETSEVISTYVYKQGLTEGLPQYSFATAIGLFVSVINLILLVTVNRITGKLSGSSLF